MKLMHTEVKMLFTKKLVNFAAWFLLKLVPEAKATYPQTVAVREIFKVLRKVYSIEAFAGRFKDRHFLVDLAFMEKVLVYLGEHDRYYRQWLGLLMLRCKRQVEIQLKTLDYEQCMALIEKQWEQDLRPAISRAVFSAYREDFLNVVLTDFLMNLPDL